MMDCLTYMRWNMATCANMDYFNAWEERERMSPIRRSHWRPAKFKHRPTEWLLMSDGRSAVYKPLWPRPVDPRMSAQEASWAMWEGRESARPYRISGRARRHGPPAKWHGGHRGELTTYEEWREERRAKEQREQRERRRLLRNLCHVLRLLGGGPA